MTLSKKIDFAVVFQVNNANPNGDPLNGNRPRATYENFGEVSDVCLKRKIRDRLQEMGEDIYVQSDDRKKDDHPSLKARFEANFPTKNDQKEIEQKACKKWFDVRAFGQLFPFKGKKTGKNNPNEGEDDAKGVSIGIRGPVSIHPAFSTTRIEVVSAQITKSVSGEGDGKTRSSDTMGMKHRIEHGIYVFYGSMNPQLAEKTGFSDDDAQKIKTVLTRLFENDASAARPEGSMEVLKVIWWEHNCRAGQLSSAKIHRSMKITDAARGWVEFDEIGGPRPEVINGF